MVFNFYTWINFNSNLTSSCKSKVYQRNSTLVLDDVEHSIAWICKYSVFNLRIQFLFYCLFFKCRNIYCHLTPLSLTAGIISHPLTSLLTTYKLWGFFEKKLLDKNIQTALQLCYMLKCSWHACTSMSEMTQSSHHYQ